MTTYSFPVDGPLRLDLRVGHGGVRIISDDDVAQARVDIAPRADTSDAATRATVELRGGTLVVHLPRGRNGVFDLPLLGGHWSRRDATDVTVVVPPGTDAKVVTYGADVTHTGTLGAADIGWGTATVRLDRVEGDARLQWGAGRVDVASVTGDVVLRSGAGDARFGRVGGRLAMACGSGHLSVEQAGGAVHLRAGSGGADIGAAGGDVDLTTGSGDLTIGLAEGATAHLDVLTGSGQLLTEMPVQDSRTDSSRGARPITVRARTGSGDIRVRRAAAVAVA